MKEQRENDARAAQKYCTQSRIRYHGCPAEALRVESNYFFSDRQNELGYAGFKHKTPLCICGRNSIIPPEHTYSRTSQPLHQVSARQCEGDVIDCKSIQCEPCIDSGMCYLSM